MQKRKFISFQKSVIAAMAVSFSLMAGGCSLLDDSEESSGEFYTEDFDAQLVESSAATAEDEDMTATILIYMVGSDLESESGCATADISEICNAELSDNINIILQTGGASAWQNDKISADSVQRYRVENGDIVLLEDIGFANMAEEATLSDFLAWGAENYEADRMGVILWNHGGGTTGGFGADEYANGAMLSLSQMQSAFAFSGAHFDFIGFDACLMATIETAYTLMPYADYLIASEETEPGTGWYYTDWLSELSRHPSASVPEIGSNIIRSFVDGPDKGFWDVNTLAVIDLSKIEALRSILFSYLEESRSELDGTGYQRAAYARSKSKSYGDGEFEQVDIRDFLDYADVPEDAEIRNALQEAVVCFDTNLSHSYGLAMYFPYDYLGYYDYMLAEFNAIGYSDEEYSGFFNSFLSMMINGQIDVSVPPVSAMTGYIPEEEPIDYEEIEWYDGEIEASAGQADFPLTENNEIYVDDSGENAVVNMTQEQWNLITYIEMQVLLDDGEGMIDFGADNVYELDDEDNLLVDFDYQWVAIDGQIVPFYAEEEGEREDGSWYTYGYVPAELTSVKDGSVEDIEILLYWDAQHEDGYVAGYRRENGDGPGAYARNLMQFTDGDVISYLCDYYTYDGEYDDSYYFGEPLTIEGELTVSYENVDEYTTWVSYCIRDIYNNEYYTETMEYRFE